MKNVLIDKFMSEMRKSDYNYFSLRGNCPRFGPSEQPVPGDDRRPRDVHCLTTLNSYISVKAKDKSEVDLYLDTLTRPWRTTRRAFQQIELLLNIRQIFQEIRQNPERRDAILARKSVLQSMFEFLKKLFPMKSVDDSQKLTIESLKKNMLDLTPVVEEVQELKNGIMQDYRELY